MSRPRRKPAPTARVHVICTGRGSHDPRPLDELRMERLPDGTVIFKARGGPPVEGNCYRFRCGQCRRNAKIRKERMLPLVTALAEQQGTHDDTPIVVDISMIERAL